jgi:SAM-dependent methyltransferase
LHQQKRTDPYFHVSNIYRHLMNFVSYKWWARYIYSILRNKVVENPAVLELGAGNCSLAKYLIKFYPDYIASDISFSMLHNSKLKISQVCCDMSSLPFKKKFDLIISSFDSINYLTNKKILLKTFKEVYKILNTNGIFSFDVALENNSYKHERTANIKGKKSGISYFRQSEYLRASRIHKNIFTFNYPDGQTLTEVHRQKIYSFETYFEMSKKSGLRVMNCYKAFTQQTGKASSDRIQFIMKRIN